MNNIETLILVFYFVWLISDAYLHKSKGKNTSMKPEDVIKYGKIYHTFNAVTKLVILFIIWRVLQIDVLFLGQMILSYMFIRFAIFDYLYNLVAKNDVLYVGTTASTDILIRKIFNLSNPDNYAWIILIKVFSLMSGLALILGV
jgi:hypothetical protein